MDLRWPRVYRRSNVGLVHYVPVIVSPQNFQELLPMTKVMSMQKVKVTEVITQLSVTPERLCFVQNEEIHVKSFMDVQW